VTNHIPWDRILDALTEGVCTTSPDLRITIFNQAAERITGYTASEAVGMPLSDMFRPEVCDCVQTAVRAIEERCEVRDVRTQIRCRRERLIPIRLCVQPVEGEQGESLGLVLTFRDISEVETLRKELKCEYCTQDIVTKSHRMRALLEILPHVAQSDSSVLILGESGTGKELLARAIHKLSAREDGPFIAVNCGALPDNLLESELFGYKAGAFTDARKDKPGRFALAEGGTLFLDEIGDISPAMQVKLLRVLQEKQYEPLGGVKTIPTNVRILTATNRDLRIMMADETFRPDLYYRINVVELQLPPLNERREDLPLLIEHFIEKHNAEKGKSISGISQAALNRLMQHDFPGNIRELENIIERAYIMCPFDSIQEECLMMDGAAGSSVPRNPEAKEIADAASQAPSFQSFPTRRDSYEFDSRRKMLTNEEEKERIAGALEENKGHRRRTAESLGIDPSTLWRKMKKHGLD